MKGKIFAVSVFMALAGRCADVDESMVNQCLNSLGYAVAMELSIDNPQGEHWYFKTTYAGAQDYISIQQKSAAPKLVIPMHLLSGGKDWHKFEFSVNKTVRISEDTGKVDGSWVVWNQQGVKITNKASFVDGVDGEGKPKAIYYVIVDAPELVGTGFYCQNLSGWKCICQHGCFLAIPKTEKVWQLSFGDVRTKLDLGESVSVVPHVVDKISGVTNENAVVSSIGFWGSQDNQNLTYSGGIVRANATIDSSDFTVLTAVMDLGDGSSLTNTLKFSVQKPADEDYVERAHIKPNTVLKSGNWTELDSASRNALKRSMAHSNTRVTIEYDMPTARWNQAKISINSKYWLIAAKDHATTHVSETIYFADGFDSFEQFAFVWSNSTVTDIHVAFPPKKGLLILFK